MHNFPNKIDKNVEKFKICSNKHNTDKRRNTLEQLTLKRSIAYSEWYTENDAAHCNFVSSLGFW